MKIKINMPPSQNIPEENEDYLYYKNKGFNIISVDLKENQDIIKNKLKNVDIIHMAGGDLNYLLLWVKKAKLNDYLANLIKNGVIYVGVSAGTVLVTPDIGLTWWKKEDIDDHIGLGIVNFSVCVHQNENDQWTNSKKLLKERSTYKNI